MSNSETDLTLLQPVIDKYGKTEGSAITILQKAQDIYGYLPEEVILHISEATGVKPAKLIGVATFYTQFRLKPSGKNIILLCQGTACHVNSSVAIQAALSEELGIDEGETTPDGLFTLNSVACLGCCSLSPVMMINGETYGSLTPEMAKKIVRDMKEDQA